jgi:hypothetical protein
LAVEGNLRAGALALRWYDRRKAGHGSKKAGLTDARQLKILPDLAAKVLAACMLVGGGIETI